MHRRALLVRSTALLSTLFLARTAAAAQDVTVIYVGGWDCPYCVVWKNENKARWLASDLYKKVRYVEVDPPRLKEAYEERYWPDQLWPVLKQVPRKSGTPRFLVVKNGKIVANEFGSSKWNAALAAIAKAVGQVHA